MLGWGWACATPIHAGVSDFGFGLSFTHNSNIARVETNPQREWTRTLMAGLFYQENTIDVTARVLVQVERRNFYHNSFSDDTNGFLDGGAIWTILPRRFTWTVEDTFRQVLLDVAAPDTPTNRAKTNSLSTGPDFTFPFSSTNSAVIGGRYGRFDIENSNSDNRRYTAYVRGVHALSAQTKVSLNYERGLVFFEPGAQPYPEVLRQDLFGRYENHSATNSTVIDLGTSRVTPYGGSELEGRLARLAVSEAFSSQSAVRLALSDQISDTYTDMIAGITSSTAPRDTGVVALSAGEFISGDLYHSQRGDLGYGNNDGHFGYTLQVYGRRVDFVNLNQDDYQEKGTTFLWTWVYSGATRFSASATYAKRFFENIDREDQDRNFAAGVTFRPNRNMTITMEGGRTERQSTAPSNSFVDSRVMLLLGYSSGPLYEVRSRR